MKAFVTVPIGAESSRTTRQPRTAHYKITVRKSLLKRFQHFIESTDWEEKYLCNHWIDKVCLGGMILSLIYFIPLLIAIIQR